MPWVLQINLRKDPRLTGAPSEPRNPGGPGTPRSP